MHFSREIEEIRCSFHVIIVFSVENPGIVGRLRNRPAPHGRPSPDLLAEELPARHTCVLAHQVVHRGAEAKAGAVAHVLPRAGPYVGVDHLLGLAVATALAEADQPRVGVDDVCTVARPQSV